MGLHQTLVVALLVVRFCDCVFYSNSTLNSTGNSLSLSSVTLPSSSSSLRYSSSISLSSTESEGYGSSANQRFSISYNSSSHWTNSRSSVPHASFTILPVNSSVPRFGTTVAPRSSHSFHPAPQHNGSSARVTGTDGLRTFRTGYHPRLTGLGTGISNVTTSHKWSNASMTAPPGFAIYGNSSFRTNCAFKTSYHSTDCYATCTKQADRCWSEWYTWSQANNAYQSSMREAHGTVSVPEKTLLYTFPASTIVTYWTTVTAIPQYYTEVGFTSTVGTYTRDIDSCVTLSTFSSDGTAVGAQYVNTCASGERSTVTTVVQEVHPTTSTMISTATYVLSSSVLSVLPPSTSTSVRMTTSEFTGFASPSPTCSFTNCMPPKNCGTCTISGGHVELLYWPVPASSTPSPSGIFTNASVTSPATMVVEGVTITSPSVAISFETAYAMNDCNKTVGAAHTGSILVLPPGDVFSLLMGHGIGGMPGQTRVDDDGQTHVGPYFPVTHLNYADLNWPYPLSAWLEQPRCHGYPGACDYIVSGELSPILAVPDALKTMDPAWASCDVAFGGLYDPPSALTAQPTVAKPTLPSEPETTSAEPQKTPDAPPASTKPTTVPPIPTGASDAPQSQLVGGDRTTNTPTTTSFPIVTLGTGSSAVTVRPGESTGQVIADSGDGPTTLDPGFVGTINNTPLTVDETGNVVLSVASTVSVDPAPTIPAPVTIIGTNTVGANPSGSGVVINSATTLSPGQVAIVDNGDGTFETISVDPSNSVVLQNGSESPSTLAVPTAASPQVVGGQTVSSASGGGIVLGGSTTLSAGGLAVTTDGVVFSVAPDGGFVVGSSSTASRHAVETTDTIDGLVNAILSVFTANTEGTTSTFRGNSATFTAVAASDGSDKVVIRGSGTTLTLIPGETGFVDGQVVRVDSTGGFNIGMATELAEQKAATSAPVLQVTAGTFVAGGSMYTAIQQGGTSAGVIIDGTTLSTGETVTMAGDTISLSPSGLVEINADGSTSTIPLVASEMTVVPSTEVEALLTLTHAGNVETITAYQLAGERGVVEIDGHTLSVGGDALTMAGVTISLRPGGYLVTKSAGETGWDTVPFASVTQTRPGLPSRFGAWATATKSTSAAASAGQSVTAVEPDPTSAPKGGAVSMQISTAGVMAAAFVFAVLLF